MKHKLHKAPVICRIALKILEINSCTGKASTFEKCKYCERYRWSEVAILSRTLYEAADRLRELGVVIKE